MTAKGNPEPRMLIDGKLVEASRGKTFTDVHPATDEELGQVAEASGDDMRRAITAACRAFDETDWSFRRRCLEQLQVGTRNPRGSSSKLADRLAS